jgi:hypothetical protein
VPQPSENSDLFGSILWRVFWLLVGAVLAGAALKILSAMHG